MLYRPSESPVPFEKRSAVNQGILNLIRGGKRPDRQKVFSAYTGKGGLHGLKYADFANRFEYTDAKRRLEIGQFFTPDIIVQLIANFLSLPDSARVADLTCGHGAFANHFGNFFGLELDSDAADVARYLYPKTKIETGDLRSWVCNDKFDAICGNPPFALRWSVPDCPLASAAGEASSEDVFLWKAANSLSVGGSLCFVAPASWLNDDLVHSKALEFIAQRFVRVSEVLLPIDAFKSVGVDQFCTKIVLLRTFLPNEKPSPTKPVVVDGRASSAAELLKEWRSVCSKYFDFRSALGEVRSELKHADQVKGRNEVCSRLTVDYRFLRLLNELKRVNPSAGPSAEIDWENANKPAEYDREGNRLPQITRDAVIKKVRRSIRVIDCPSRDLVRVVRTKRGIEIKAYSRVAKLSVEGVSMIATNSQIATGELSIAQIRDAIQAVRDSVSVRNLRRRDKDPSSAVVGFEDLNIEPTAKRIRSAFMNWERPLDVETSIVQALKSKVESFYSSFHSKGVFVQPRQVEEIARCASKPGAFLSWEMGCGKSLASLAWDYCKVDEDLSASRKSSNGWTVLVSSTLAIDLHWKSYLSHFGFDWRQLDSRDDWTALSYGSKSCQKYLLVTHHQLSKFGRIIRSHTKSGVVRAFIVDESDEFGNRAATRSRSLLVAGRSAAHKLLLTGTPIRNSSSEVFAQLEFLLHGNPFFRCVSERILSFDRSRSDFVTRINDHFGQPYTGRGGFALFKRCHSPSKPTVMGAERSLPLLPGSTALLQFLGCFRSRLRLQELASRIPYIRETMSVALLPAERAEYDELENNAIAIASKHLRERNSDQSVRRNNMLSLAHAIHLLQRASSLPESYRFTDSLASKHRALVQAIRVSGHTHIAIGVLWREVVSHIAGALTTAFPDRVVVAFDGDMSFNARRKALELLNRSPKAILVTTQQSLRSSLNLPIVGEVFAEALPWNFTSLNQWAMRFCRLNSKHTVKVNLLVAAGTIEERILGLILRKETVARSIAGDEFAGEEQLLDEYGIDSSDLDDLALYLSEKNPNLRSAA